MPPAPLLFLFAVLCTANAADYSSLDFEYSAEVAEVPSRALIATLNIGVPVLRRPLMVDFSRDVVELEDCIKAASYTYDLADTSDVVLFEEEQITDARARASYRVRVEEHCEDIGALGERYYRNCVSGQCRGVLGLSRSSPFWQVWSAYTLGLDGVKLGNDHPRTLEQGARNSPVVQCAATTQGVCDFETHISAHGRQFPSIVASFHTENSYTYVPPDIYELFRSGNASSMQLTDARGLLLVDLDRAILTHSPDAWHAHSATSRTAANLFFSQHTRSSETLLVKPWNHKNRISIGNAALEHYTVHVDLARNTATLEFRVRREHVYFLALGIAILLFFLLLRYVCLSVYEMSWLANRLPVSCACGDPSRHVQSVGAFVNWFAAVVVLVLSVYAVVDAVPFIDEPLDFGIFLTLFGLNWILLGVQLTFPVRWHRRLHRHAQHSTGHFYRVLAFSWPLETIMVLSLVFLLATTRQDSLGTLGTSFVAIFGVFNSWRYTQYCILRQRGNAYVLLLALLNLGGLATALVWRILYDFLLSWPLALAWTMCAVALACLVVDLHSRARLCHVLASPAHRVV